MMLAQRRSPLFIGLASAVGLGLANVAGVDRMNTAVKLMESIEAQTQMPQAMADIFHGAWVECHTEGTH